MILFCFHTENSYAVEFIVIEYGRTESINDFKKELDKQGEEKHIETYHRWRHRKLLKHRCWCVKWRAYHSILVYSFSLSPLNLLLTIVKNFVNF